MQTKTAPKVAIKKQSNTAFRTLSVTFNLPLEHRQLEAFRGAFADMAGRGNDLFHNHNNAPDAQNKVIERYPRIQYRVHNKHASVFAINEGALVLSKLLGSAQLNTFNMGGRNMALQITEMREVHEFKPKLLPRGQMQQYRIYKWIPLNQANYRLYKAFDEMRDKVIFLETIMCGHIVAFAESIGWPLPQNRKVKVTINDIDRVTKVNIFGTDMMAFDLVFSANAALPDRLGLGRKTAFGFGWIYRFVEE